MSKSRDYGIQVWFWSRNCPDVPPEIAQGGLFKGDLLFPNPTWGEPAGDFPPDSCKYDQYFDAHQIIFDLTFCVSEFPFIVISFARLFSSTTEASPQGDWAGNAWATSGCGMDTCDNCKHPLAYDYQLPNSSTVTLFLQL